MLYSDYLDLDPRDAAPLAAEGRVASAAAPGTRSWLRIATIPGAGGAGKDCPAANDVPATDLSTDLSADAGLAGRSGSFAWADLGSVLGNFLGGGLLIGGLFLMPFALRQLLDLL